MELINAETETHLLSAFLRDAAGVGRKCIERQLPQDAFAIPENRTMYAFLMGCYSEDIPMQRFAIGRSLKRQGVLDAIGGPERLDALFLTDAPTSMVDTFIDDLRELSRRRQLVQATKQAAFDIEAGKGVGETEERLRRVLDLADTSNGVEIKTPTEMNIELMERATRNDTIATGFDAIDGLTALSVGPMCRGDLLVVAGQRKAGKSILAVNIASKIARNHPVVVFTIEMSRSEVWKRIVSAESGVTTRYWGANHTATLKERMSIDAAMRRLEETRLHIVDNVTDIDQSVAIAKMLKIRYGDLGAVVWDYAQLFDAKGFERRNETVSYISMITKRASATLKCLGIAVSQLNDDGRALESRGPERDCNAMLEVSQGEEGDERHVACLYNRSGPMGFNLEMKSELEFCRFVNA